MSRESSPGGFSFGLSRERVVAALREIADKIENETDTSLPATLTYTRKHDVNDFVLKTFSVQYAEKISG